MGAERACTLPAGASVPRDASAFVVTMDHVGYPRVIGAIQLSVAGAVSLKSQGASRRSICVLRDTTSGSLLV
jgi:hypothetical protein